MHRREGGFEELHSLYSLKCRAIYRSILKYLFLYISLFLISLSPIAVTVSSIYLSLCLHIFHIFLYQSFCDYLSIYTFRYSVRNKEGLYTVRNNKECLNRFINHLYYDMRAFSIKIDNSKLYQSFFYSVGIFVTVSILPNTSTYCYMSILLSFYLLLFI